MEKKTNSVWLMRVAIVGMVISVTHAYTGFSKENDIFWAAYYLVVAAIWMYVWVINLKKFKSTN